MKDISGLSVRATTPVYFVGVIIQAMANVLVTPFLTRILSPGDYGVVTNAIIVSTVLQMLVGLGLQGSVTRARFYEPAGEDGARRVVCFSVTVAGALGTVVAATAPTWAEPLLQVDDVRVAVAIALHSALVASVMAVTALMRAKGAATKAVVATVLVSPGGQLLGLLAIVVLPPSPVVFLSAMALAAGTSLVISLVFEPISARMPNRSIARWAIHLGVPAVFHGLGMHLLNLGDRLIIGQHLGLQEVARYHVAYLVGFLGLVVVQAFNKSWGPSIYATPLTARWRYLAATTDTLSAAAGLLVTGTALMAPVALQVLAPASYEPRSLVTISVIVSFSVLIFVEYLAGVHVLYDRDQNRALMWVTPAAATFNLALNWVLVPRVGLLGAGIATVLAYLFQAFAVRVAASSLAPVPVLLPHLAKRWTLVAAAITLLAWVPATGLPWMAARTLASITLVLIFGARVRGGRLILDPSDLQAFDGA